MVYFRGFSVLDVDGNVSLPTAVDLATGSRHMDSVRHVFMDKFFVEFIHKCFDNTGGISAGDVAV